MMKRYHCAFCLCCASQLGITSNSSGTYRSTPPNEVSRSFMASVTAARLMPSTFDALYLSASYGPTVKALGCSQSESSDTHSSLQRCKGLCHGCATRRTAVKLLLLRHLLGTSCLSQSTVKRVFAAHDSISNCFVRASS